MRQRRKLSNPVLKEEDKDKLFRKSHILRVVKPSPSERSKIPVRKVKIKSNDNHNDNREYNLEVQSRRLNDAVLDLDIKNLKRLSFIETKRTLWIAIKKLTKTANVLQTLGHTKTSSKLETAMLQLNNFRTKALNNEYESITSFKNVISNVQKRLRTTLKEFEDSLKDSNLPVPSIDNSWTQANLKKVKISNEGVQLIEAPLFLGTYNVPLNKMGYFLQDYDIEKSQNGVVIQSKFLVFKVEHLIRKKIKKKSDTEMGDGREAAQKFWDKWTKIYTAKFPPEKQLPFYIKKLSRDYRKPFTAIPGIYKKSKTKGFYAVWVIEKKYSKQAGFLSDRTQRNFDIRIDFP